MMWPPVVSVGIAGAHIGTRRCSRNTPRAGMEIALFPARFLYQHSSGSMDHDEGMA